MNMSDPILVNVTEEIVRGLVSFLLRGPEYQTFCKCTICEFDTVALTLNALPSKYVTSMEARDEAFKEMNTPESIERINKEIIHALHVVNKYPRHKVEPTS
ncbi:late competence development ComFB family protein [Lysinibacillus irui]|uniref:Late competence development ComFB family protein n=3 Tax=Bacillaceae TaxID=186817 RepID=A0AAJ5UV83_9BACI|nr:MULTISPECIES: late competence development ComFB family protein [Lysinibacillus]MEA0552657.1 late competence development ComFB family protein [Lysinibacillus irui]MEA0563035.1 late competence development ComFB family protein [Lysinibacillus irui]MEA0978609.1 late competence development ComFB family protein [Lysinibacillus irui]MEA1044763.1 late competence development ComFB family protein [Lysinibacillus irui]WDV06520.1 late competence development ComFB family protein [Lysinibacillus irui]